MQNYQPSVLMREDTMLGVCEGLGEDLRINPLFLRLAFTGFLFWNPVAAVAVYLGLGVIVAASRLLVPNPRLPAVEVEAEAAEGAQEPVADKEAQEERQPLPIAA
jgi:phage shock protein PspC (stress-responsive transcriptional regulator)